MRGKRPASPASISLQCPGQYRTQLARWAPTASFVEFACDDCRKEWRRKGGSGRIARILHRYSTETGELLETVYQIGTGPKPFLIYEHQIDAA